MFKRWLSPPQGNFLLLGPRRCGKTTFIRANFPDFAYITLDDFDYLNLAESDPKGLLDKFDKVVVDEIQRVPKLTIAVKYAIDQKLTRVILSGSSRIGLLDATADTLAGRIEIFDLPTCCWGEKLGAPTHRIFFDKADPLQLKKAQRELANAMLYGGFPEVVNNDDILRKQAILKNYRNTYFTRDLAQISNIENISGLLAILNYFGLGIGSLTQISKFRDEAGLSHQTAQKYLNVIYQAGLGFTLHGYQYGPAKRYLKASKSYFADNGILTGLGLTCSQGQTLENFVISELEKRRKLGLLQTDQFFYYQSIGGAEIDLVFTLNDLIYAVEIKSSKRPQKRDIRHLRTFIADNPKGRRGYVFYLGHEYVSHDNITFIPVTALYRGM